MDKKVAALIDSYQEEFVSTLARWMEIPSVKAEPAPGAPFGTQVRRMLDVAMADAAAMGFSPKNYDGYACDMTLGDAQDTIAVLGHLDVVPAGDGWQTPPFQAVVEGDKIIGRGSMDDKGPVLAALFAMRAIKEAGVPLKRAIRLILGCDEESGWADMDYYTAHAQMPEMGFSPDASFPIINTEKAMIHAFVTAPLSCTGLQVKQLWTGERLNVIPGESKALLSGGQELAQQVASYAAATGLPYTAQVTPEGVWVTAEGIPGHSAYPEGRRNAIGMMLLLLKALGVEGPLLTLANTYGLESNGASLGCACQDEVSGALTCNMGILHIENGTVTASLDMRVPVTADLNALEQNARAALPGFTFQNVEHTAPHHVPAEGELVSQLLAAYHEETGLDAYPMATGGGTYAKVLQQGVAFGAGFPDDEDLAHQAGEYASISGLLKAAKVYANALLRLCAA